MLGTRQSGSRDLRFAQLAGDRALLEQARHEAAGLVGSTGPLDDEVRDFLGETDVQALSSRNRIDTSTVHRDHMDPIALTLLVLCIVLVGAMWVALARAEQFAARVRVRASRDERAKTLPCGSSPAAARDIASLRRRATTPGRPPTACVRRPST